MLFDKLSSLSHWAVSLFLYMHRMASLCLAGMCETHEPCNCFSSGRNSEDQEGVRGSILLCWCSLVEWQTKCQQAGKCSMLLSFLYMGTYFACFCLFKKIDHGMIICQLNKQGSPLCYGLGMAVRSFLLLFDSVIVTTCYPYLTQRFKNLNLVLPWNSLWSVSLEPSDIRDLFFFTISPTP